MDKNKKSVSITSPKKKRSKCPDCGFRIRSKNHTKGSHHLTGSTRLSKKLGII